MRLPRFNRIKMTAPAVVVLATVVNAAVPAAQPLNAMEFGGVVQAAGTVDLGWAVNGGTQNSQATRAALARKAASDIRSMELSSAAFPLPQLITAAPPSISRTDIEPLAISPQESTHQHSAP